MAISLFGPARAKMLTAAGDQKAIILLFGINNQAKKGESMGIIAKTTVHFIPYGRT
jgi:hypothetical protein